MEELVKIVKKWFTMWQLSMRPCVSKLTVASVLIHIGPCLIHNICLAADGANTDAQIYDGRSNKDEEKVHLEALSGTTFNWTHSHPCLFNYGVYVIVAAANAHVIVTYKPITVKERKILLG